MQRPDEYSTRDAKNPKKERGNDNYLREDYSISVYINWIIGK